MRNTDGISEKLLDLWRAGDALAQDKIYQILRRRFLHAAQKILHDPAYAEESLHDAFLKLDRRVREKRLHWQGEGCFYTYAKTAVRQAALDLYRRIFKGKNAQYEANHRFYHQCDDEADIEYVERLAGERFLEVEARVERTEDRHSAWEAYCAGALTEQDRHFWQAYQAMEEIPGSQLWSPQQITAFIQAELADLGLSENAFYTAHSRFKGRLAKFLGGRVAPKRKVGTSAKSLQDSDSGAVL